MQHVLESPKTADQTAGEISDLLNGYGITSCDVLPAHDRVVVHLPLAEAERFLMESRAVRGASSRAEYPKTPNWDIDEFY